MCVSWHLAFEEFLLLRETKDKQMISKQHITCTNRGVNIIFVLTCISMVNTEIDNVHYGFVAAGDWSAIVAAQMFSQRI